MSEDPLENAELVDGPNLYAYVKNNPMNFWDSLGLNDKPKRNIDTEGFNAHSDPKDVQKKLDEANKQKNKPRAANLRTILKVCSRNAKFVVPIQAFLNAFEQEFGPIIPNETPAINPWTGKPVPML